VTSSSTRADAIVAFYTTTPAACAASRASAASGPTSAPRWHDDAGRYWYLSAAPELLALAGQRLEQHLEDRS
jgi:hypothetical protein